MLGMRGVDQENGAGDSAQFCQVENASTRLWADAEVVRDNQQRASALHG